MDKRKVWVLVGLLAATNLITGALLFPRLQFYLVAQVEQRRPNLTNAKLRGASLAGANLQGARLVTADLRGADLRKADLRNTQLIGTDLRKANLAGADLRGACLRSCVGVLEDKGWTIVHECTDLRGADLRGADLRGADLIMLVHIDGREIPSRWGAEGNVVMTGALYDTNTRWPKGFDPKYHGARLMD
jgi:hypothetical protein